MSKSKHGQLDTLQNMKKKLVRQSHTKRHQKTKGLNYQSKIELVNLLCFRDQDLCKILRGGGLGYCEDK